MSGLYNIYYPCEEITMTDNRCDADAKFSKEDNHSLEVLGNWITQKKKEETGRLRKPSRQELVARSNARPKCITKTDVTPSQITVVEHQQMARDVISPSGRRVGREMVTITVRRKAPVRDFLSVGAWGF